MEMEAFDWGSDILGDDASDAFQVNNAVIGSGYDSSLSLVLGRERGELGDAPPKLEQKGVCGSTERSIEALKSHSEAERKRRARINTHLDTLRSVIQGATKMDKASLLGEVIRHLKELKRISAEACEGLMIPNDKDEISVEEQESGMNLNGFSNYSIRALLCCEYTPGLLSNIREALEALHLMIMKADIATFGGRMKSVFVLVSCKELNFEDRQFLAGSVHQALRSVLNRFSVSQDMLGARKRRRISIFSSHL